MNDRTTTLTDRIAFAEDWLSRARRQFEDGQAAHGALTMMLAEAELHRAREVGAPPALAAGARRPRPWWSVGAFLAASAVAGLGVALAVARVGPQPEPHAGGPALLTLGGTGDVLRLVTASEPSSEPVVVERTVVKSIIVRVPAPAVGRLPDRTTRDSLPPVHVVVAAGAPKAPQAAPAAVQGVPPPAVVAAPPAPAPSLFSEADVIELVLAAERSLRRSANQ